MNALVLATMVVAVQVSLFLGYFVVRTVVVNRPVAWVMWLAGAVVVSLFLWVAMKSLCHECLTTPSVAVCEHSNNAFDVEIDSNRIGGHFKERQFAGCYFYWHENDTHGIGD